MVIQELKPSKRVEGRWLAVLEDGSILRLGEGEVIGFSLYAGKELTEEEAQSLLDCARRSALKEKALNLLSRKPQSRRELERKLKATMTRLDEIKSDEDSIRSALIDAKRAAAKIKHQLGCCAIAGERRLKIICPCLIIHLVTKAIVYLTECLVAFHSAHLPFTFNYCNRFYL